jgi:hypothetical protein
MPEVINIYCDESCHLENDHLGVMVLGAIWCPQARTAALAGEARRLKQQFGLSSDWELKWVKVSNGRLDYYRAVLDWFWRTDDLHFRALIVPDKSKLDHEAHRQTHDEWYYKMYFDLLKVIIDPKQHYNIYLDLKDTRGAAKVRKLHEALCNAQYLESGNKVRTYLWLEVSDCVVILEKTTRRGKDVAYFLVTAFHLDGASRRKAMRRKYDNRVQ